MGLLTMLKKNFQMVANVKPPASRADSSEKYVVAMGYRGVAPAPFVDGPDADDVDMGASHT